MKRTIHEIYEILLDDEYTSLQENLSDHIERLDISVGQEGQLNDMIDELVTGAVEYIATRFIDHIHPDSDDDALETSRVYEYQIHAGLMGGDSYTWKKAKKFR